MDHFQTTTYMTDISTTPINNMKDNIITSSINSINTQENSVKEKKENKKETKVEAKKKKIEEPKEIKEDKEEDENLKIPETAQEKKIERIKEKLSKRLNKEIKYLEKLIFGFILLALGDFILLFVFQEIFCNILNIIIITIRFFSLIFCFYIFKVKMKIINRKVYKFIVKIFYATIAATVLFYIDTMYVLIAKMFLNSELDWGNGLIFLWLFFIFAYAAFNFTLPVLIMVQILKIRNTIKTYGYYEGKDYSMIRTGTFNQIPNLFSSIELETINRK